MCVEPNALHSCAVSKHSEPEGREPAASTASFLVPICLCICYLGHKEVCKPGIWAVNLK